MPLDPPFDPAYADTLTDTDDVHIEYDCEPSDDGGIVTIRRTVWKKAYRRKDQDILWQAAALQLPRDQVPELIKDLAYCLVLDRKQVPQ